MKIFKRIYENIIGILSALGLAINTLFWFPIIMTVVLFRILTWGSARRAFRRIGFRMAELWVSFNTAWFRLLHRKNWKNNLEGLSKKEWYIVISNHRSWVDILILQSLFDKKIPLLKFFIKKQLFWFPIMGIVWWGLEFPFMNRYSKEKLAKNPKLIGKDLEESRQMSERSKEFPTAIFNFPEGTRYSRAKSKRQGDEFKHLLKPKAGGIAMSLKTLNTKIQELIDVTLVYGKDLRDKKINIWDFLCGRVKDVKVSIEKLKLPNWIKNGDYEKDSEFKAKFQEWLNARWHEKDKLIDSFFPEDSHKAKDAV